MFQKNQTWNVYAQTITCYFKHNSTGMYDVYDDNGKVTLNYVNAWTDCEDKWIDLGHCSRTGGSTYIIAVNLHNKTMGLRQTGYTYYYSTKGINTTDTHPVDGTTYYSY